MVNRVRSHRLSTKLAALIALTSLFFAVANWLGESVHAANFTSTQSGSWGSASTWGGAGVPGCGDDVTIAIGHTVTLDTTRCANNLTINNGGALDLAGSEMDFSGTGTTFTNNGTVNNTGGFNRILFNVTGNLTQTLSGTGNYSGNLKLQLFSNVGQPATFNVAPGTSLNFSNGTGNGNDHNIEFGPGPTVNVTNALTVIAPSSGNYVNLSNSATMSGAGGLKTQGNMKIVSNGNIAAPVEIVSGAALAEGTSSGNWTVDSAASLSLTNTLNLSGNMTIPSGATVDLAAGEIDFLGNGTTFTNNGTVNNTGGFNRILFNVTGNLTQTLSGTGNYSGTLKLQLFSNVGQPATFNVAPGTSLNFSNGTGNGNDHNIELGPGPTVNVTNALTVIAPSSGNYVNLSNSATMSGAGGLKTQGHVKIVGSNIAAPVEIVSGAALAEGTSSGNWMVDSGASLSTTNTLNLSGNVTISSGATVDLVGGEMDFLGNGTTFTNNGTVNNTGGFTRILFNVTGNLTQTLSGTGTYGPVKLEFFANVGGPGTINVASGTSLNFTNGTGNANDANIQVDGGTTLNFIGSGSLTLSNSVSNSGTIIINGGGVACGDATKILIRSNVDGMQRSWSGGGTFSVMDVDVKDQAGSANITAIGGVNSGNNGVNWTFVPCSCTSPPSGLVGWWPGDGNANDVANGNNGTLQGGAAFASGEVGQAFSFNGTDGNGVMIGNPAALQLQNFTIDAWVKRSRLDISGSGPYSDGGIVGYGYPGYSFGMYSDGRLYLTRGLVDSYADSGSSIKVADTNFHHVAITKSGTTVMFYVDGIPGAPITYDATFSFSKNVSVGAFLDVTPPNASTHTSSFAGLMDEVEVFNRALSQSEIQAIVNAGSAGKCKPPTPTVQFDSSNYMVGEGDGHKTITVTRTGDTSGTSTVDYMTTDTDTFTVNCSTKQGQAYGRCDFATVVGTLSFAAGETVKTFTVPIIDDGYAEGLEIFSVALSNPTGATLGAQPTATISISDNETTDGANPILQANAAGVDFFVRQHYLDFLGREPEPGQPWSNVLNGCADQFNINPNSPSAGCDRITVSGAFFGSPEFKVKGIYVIDFYRVAFNQSPTYTQFSIDNASVTGTTAADTNARRAAYANNFVQRTTFTTLYGAMTNTQFVNALMSGSQGQNYNLTSIRTPNPANPDDSTEPNKVTLTTTDLINALNGATLTKAQVLRAIVQSDQITQNLESVNAFVASQYYGYLRRAPDTGGFNGWVDYLKNNPNDFRTMVHGFLDSTEYRLRFGNPNP